MSDSSEYDSDDSVEVQRYIVNHMSRADRLRLVQSGGLEAGYYEGDEPLTFGNDPNESAQDALARLAREYTERSDQQDRDNYDPVAVIRMHDDIRGAPRSDLPTYEVDSDSDTESNAGDAFGLIRSVRRHGPNGPTRRYIIGPDGGSIEIYDDPRDLADTQIPNFHAMLVLLHFYRDAAALQTEIDAANTMNLFNDLMLTIGIAQEHIDRAYRYPEPTIEEQESDHLWEVVHSLQESLSTHQETADGFYDALNAAMADFVAEDPLNAALFRDHATNVSLLTDYQPRLLAMWLWFDNIPEDMLSAVAGAMLYRFAEVEIIRQIRSARLAAGENAADLPQGIAAHPHEFYSSGIEQAEFEYGQETRHPDAYPDGPVLATIGFARFMPEPANNPMRGLHAAIDVYLERVNLMQLVEEEVDETDARARVLDWASVANWVHEAINWLDGERERPQTTDDEILLEDVYGMLERFCSDFDTNAALADFRTLLREDIAIVVANARSNDAETSAN